MRFPYVARLVFLFAFLLSNHMAREMMRASFRYGKRKSEIKQIEIIINSFKSRLFAPYSIYKPTFAPKHLLFAWIYRIVNLVHFLTIFVLQKWFNFRLFGVYLYMLIIGILEMVFSVYCLFMSDYREKRMDLDKSLFVNHPKWM